MKVSPVFYVITIKKSTFRKLPRLLHVVSYASDLANYFHFRKMLQLINLLSGENGLEKVFRFEVSAENVTMGINMAWLETVLWYDYPSENHDLHFAFPKGLFTLFFSVRFGHFMSLELWSTLVYPRDFMHVANWFYFERQDKTQESETDGWMTPFSPSVS